MDFSVSPEADPPPSPVYVRDHADQTDQTDQTDQAGIPRAQNEELLSIAASLSRIETTLGSMERTLDAVRGVCSVNAELAAANVALAASGASGANVASVAAASGAGCGAISAAPKPNGKVVAYIVGATDVALVGNEHTFDMRSALKSSNAKWTSVPPARWVIQSEAWVEYRPVWESTFGVTFVERA
jgi:hypothetical protein